MHQADFPSINLKPKLWRSKFVYPDPVTEKTLVEKLRQFTEVRTKARDS